MPRLAMVMAASAGLAAVAAGCSSVGEVSRADLAAVIERDAVPFVGQAIPAAVLDRLAPHRLVIIGETHLLREHNEMMAALVQALHGRGFRQLLLEWPHMADWLLSDYVGERRLLPDWEPPVWAGRAMLAAIGDFNRARPPAQRIRVRAIDVNLDESGGAAEFKNLLRELSHQLPSPGPLTAFLQGAYHTPEQQAEQIETLRGELQRWRAQLVAGWGAAWYDVVAEMVEVEVASVSVRAVREDHYDLSVRLRESVMKRLADLRIAEVEGGTVLNVGGNHAQKEYLKGTDQEWLGDYLVHRSAAVAGSAVVVAVTAARIDSEPGSVRYDIYDASPPNELWRLLYEAWPDQTVFLALDDPMFAAGGVAVNFEGTIYVCALKRQYDAVVQLPLAHRLPLQ